MTATVNRLTEAGCLQRPPRLIDKKNKKKNPQPASEPVLELASEPVPERSSRIRRRSTPPSPPSRSPPRFLAGSASPVAPCTGSARSLPPGRPPPHLHARSGCSQSRGRPARQIRVQHAEEEGEEGDHTKREGRVRRGREKEMCHRTS
jgi:hypothetical protein